MAWLWPRSLSLVQPASQGSYFLIISGLASLLPPSITKYSRLGYPCSRTERIVSSRNSAWLNDGVTMLMRGHSARSGMQSGRRGHSLVHGQPVLPGGGDGSSFKEGQRIGKRRKPKEK